MYESSKSMLRTLATLAAVRRHFGHECSDKGQSNRKDVPNAKVYVLDAGHFAMDTKADEIATLVREFMTTQK